MAEELQTKELRRFGIVTGAIVAGLFGITTPWLFGHAFPVWPWAVGGALVAWALVHPASLRQVYRAWMALGHALGWVNSRIVLGLAFYVIVLPTGFVMRLFGHDPLARSFDKKSRSYRTPSTNQAKNHFERPF
jgi:uncharacterized membrane protein